MYVRTSHSFAVRSLGRRVKLLLIKADSGKRKEVGFTHRQQTLSLCACVCVCPTLSYFS